MSNSKGTASGGTMTTTKTVGPNKDTDTTDEQVPTLEPGENSPLPTPKDELTSPDIKGAGDAKKDGPGREKGEPLPAEAYQPGTSTLETDKGPRPDTNPPNRTVPDGDPGVLPRGEGLYYHEEDAAHLNDDQSNLYIKDAKVKPELVEATQPKAEQDEDDGDK